MKKILLFAVAALTLAACAKEAPLKEEGAIDASKIVFNIKVENADATKGVKTVWESGDVVYAFFEGNGTQYVKMTYNGTSWAYTDKAGGTNFAGLTLATSGKKVSALYMPGFIYSSAPEYKTVETNKKWTFGDISGFFQIAVADYTVDTENDVATLKATLRLEAIMEFVQFFVPAAEVADMPLGEGEEMVLTASNIDPVNFYGIEAGGGASSSSGATGYPLTGHWGAMGGETGYYFWGYLHDRYALTMNYQFQLVKREKSHKLAISSKSKTVSGNITDPTAIKLTGFTNNGNFVSLGYADGPLWATGNLGRPDNTKPISSNNYKIVHPLAAGDYFQWGAMVVFDTVRSTPQDEWTGTSYEGGLLPRSRDVANILDNSWRIPTKAQFDALLSSTRITRTWETGWTSIGGGNAGYLFRSIDNDLSIFLPAAGYAWEGIREAGTQGYYWCSDPKQENYAYFLSLTSDAAATTSFARYMGHSIRPVKN